MNIISQVLSACVSSAKADPIELLQPGGKKYMLPAQLNVMFLSPSGTMKSSRLMSIGRKYMERVIDYSLPGMIGSINEQGDVVPGYIMKAAGKTLGIDEFHGLTAGSRKALLSLLEGQWAERALGRVAHRPLKKSGKYLRYSIKDNVIRIDHARLSVLMSGIFAPHKRAKATIDDRAFSSRLMPLSFTSDTGEMDDMLLGKKFFDIKVDYYKESPVFEDWEKYVRTYTEVVKGMPPKLNAWIGVNSEFFLRGKLHFSRLVSWASRDNSSVVDWEKYLRYIPFFIYNYVASTLTYSEFEIYQLMSDELSQKEIATKLDCSVAYVSKIARKIRGYGLCGN